MHNFSACDRFQEALLPAVYGVEFVVALAGNLFALWLLVVRERRNWHSGVVLSCNLAVSDLLYILSLPLLVVYYSLGKHWTFGGAACKVERFLFTCNLYASIFFITAISVNRCVALAWPFFAHSNIRPLHAKAASVLIWVVVVAVSCPVWRFARICPSDYSNNTLCVSYCSRNAEDKIPHFVYKVFLAVFGCLVPFVVTFASNCVIVWVVWKSASITPLEKRKVALLVGCVVVLYAVSFLPYHVFQTYHLYQRIRNPKNTVCWAHNVYQVSKGLASLSMCVHPLLYMALFDSIRVACCGRSPEDDFSPGARK